MSDVFLNVTLIVINLSLAAAIVTSIVRALRERRTEILEDCVYGAFCDTESAARDGTINKASYCLARFEARVRNSIGRPPKNSEYEYMRRKIERIVAEQNISGARLASPSVYRRLADREKERKDDAAR